MFADGAPGAADGRTRVVLGRTSSPAASGRLGGSALGGVAARLRGSFRPGPARGRRAARCGAARGRSTRPFRLRRLGGGCSARDPGLARGLRLPDRRPVGRLAGRDDRIGRRRRTRPCPHGSALGRVEQQLAEDRGGPKNGRRPQRRIVERDRRDVDRWAVGGRSIPTGPPLGELEQPLECHGASLRVDARGVCDDNDGTGWYVRQIRCPGRRIRRALRDRGRRTAWCSRRRLLPPPHRRRRRCLRRPTRRCCG